ncbi:MAG: type II secretion system protein GspD, partial [Phycisphaerae bacterium]
MATSPRWGRQLRFAAVALVATATHQPWGYGGETGTNRSGGPVQVVSNRRPGEGVDLAVADPLQKVPGALQPSVVLERGLEEVPLGEERGVGSIRVSKAGAVEMHVANLPLSTVLETLSMQSHRNIVATPNVAGTVTAHLYKVTFEEALRAILAANGAGYREEGNFVFVYTNAELAEIIAQETPLVTRIFPLHFCTSRDALTVVTPMLSKSGTAVAAPQAMRGLKSLANDAGSDDMAQRNYIAVRDRPDVLDAVEKTLQELDVPPAQVLVEATILAVTLDDENALGVDFTVVGGVDLELLGAISNAVTDLSLGELPIDRLERFNANVSTDMSGEVPDGGLTVGVIKDHVGVFVRALESITDTVVLANPKVLALNRQRAHVIVGRRDGYLTTTVTETQAIQNIEYLETGTQLIFRPFIGDNGTVRLELHPEDSVGAVTNGLPSEQTTEVTTNVVVQDGQTVLIGGL